MSLSISILLMPMMCCLQMGVTIVKTNKDLDYVKLWLTTDYDYLASTHSLYGDFVPFKFDVRFDEKQKTKIMVVETSLRPLNK